MKDMMLTDLDTILEEVRDIESKIAEPPDITDKIYSFAVKLMSEVVNDANKKVKIITDYDADGICNAYILDKTLHKVKPDIDLEVICNDRRNPYGVPKDLKAEPETLYIIGDMGSNELDYIRKTFGEKTFILDHHLIQSEQDKEHFANDVRLLNPQSYVCEDGLSPCYCATGLALRVAQTMWNELEAYENHTVKCNATLERIQDILSKTSGRMFDLASECSKEGIGITVSPGKEADTASCRIFKDRMFNFDVTLGLTASQEEDITYRTIDKSVGIKEANFDLITNDDMNSLLRLAHINPQTGHFVWAKTEPCDDKFKNTMMVVGGIGTVSDMVDVLDVHSYNRAIIRSAMRLIDNADETNLDFVLGNILAKAGIGEEHVTAKKIGFNVGAFLNSASRMSEVIEQNGAQMMYDALSGKNEPETFIKISELSEINAERKAMMADIKNAVFYSFIERHRNGDLKDDKVAVYQMNDNLPTAFCGLVAGQICDAINKPTIAITSHYNEETQSFVYSGSGRNPPHMTSLYDFVANSLKDTGEDLKITFGGHNDAIGISSLNDIHLFEKAIHDHQNEYVVGIPYPAFLDIKPSEIGKAETLDKLRALEPLGTGLRIPPVILEGKELRRSQGFKAKNSNWKTVQLKDASTVSSESYQESKYPNDAKSSCSITDWNYSERCYPTDKSGIIRVLADMEINDYNGAHVELTAKYNRDIVEGRSKEIEKALKPGKALG